MTTHRLTNEVRLGRGLIIKVYLVDEFTIQQRQKKHGYGIRSFVFLFIGSEHTKTGISLSEHFKQISLPLQQLPLLLQKR